MNNNNMDELLINASLEERTPSALPWNREEQKPNTKEEKRSDATLKDGNIKESDLDNGKHTENFVQRKDEEARNIAVKNNFTAHTHETGGYEPSFLKTGARSRGLNSSIKISKSLIEESKQVNLENGGEHRVQMVELSKRREQKEVNSIEQHVDKDGVKGINENQDKRFKRAETEKPRQYTKPRKNVYAIYPNPDSQQKRREHKARQQKANTKDHEDKNINPLTILRRQHETIDNADDVYDISPTKDRGTLSEATDEDEDRTQKYRRTHSKDRRKCELREKSDKGNKHTLVGIATPEMNQKPARNSREITKSKKKRAQNVIDVLPCKPTEHATVVNNSDSMMRVGLPADHKNAREPRSSKSYTVTKHYENTDTLNKNSIMTQKTDQQVNSSIGIGGINKTKPKEGPLSLCISVKPLETMSGDAPERHDNEEYHNNDTVLHVAVNTEISGASSTGRADDIDKLVDEVSKLPEESDNYLNHMIRRPDSAVSVDPKLPNAWVDDRNQLRDIEIVCDLQSELDDTNENEPQHVSEENEKKLNVFQRLFSLVTCCFRSQTDH